MLLQLVYFPDDCEDIEYDDEESDAEEDQLEERSYDSASEQNISDTEQELDGPFFIGKDKITMWKKHQSPKHVRTRAENLVKQLPDPKAATKKLTDPLDIWKYFITEDILKGIVDHTNEHISASAANFSRERDTARTNIYETQALFGLLYMAGVLKSSRLNVRELYSTKGTGVEIFRLVSWVRHRDIHLLTVGRYTYTSDQRFEAIHSPHTEEWTLRIRYPQRKDSGIYECQISTTPPIGHPIHLTVVEPITEILGGPDLFINMGSTINLTCHVRYAPEPPPTMSWAHNAQTINFDSPRGGISLVTEKGYITTTRLLIQKAVQADSGLYTCDPSNANSASVRVHILNGEHPAAMHHGGCRSSLQSKLLVLLNLFLLLFLRTPT
ncbi:Immunoglobulin domain [Popillia japonica]|uniref:Immunoglobulin domain n=1 Tax=Popillia japonica TaxID=7064 RepID=A0AAW1N636_POPJA